MFQLKSIPQAATTCDMENMFGFQTTTTTTAATIKTHNIVKRAHFSNF